MDFGRVRNDISAIDDFAEKAMQGAIAGDMIGAPHEGRSPSLRDFTLFTSRSQFTDDTVLSVDEALRFVELLGRTQLIGQIGQCSTHYFFVLAPLPKAARYGLVVQAALREQGNDTARGPVVMYIGERRTNGRHSFQTADGACAYFGTCER